MGDSRCDPSIFFCCFVDYACVFLFRRLGLMWFYSLICVLYGAVERGGVLEFYGRGVQQPEKPNSLAFSNLSVYRMKVIFFDVGQKNSVYFMTVFNRFNVYDS